MGKLEKFLHLLLDKCMQKWYGKKEKEHITNSGLELKKDMKYDNGVSIKIDNYNGELYWSNGCYFLKTINGEYVYYGQDVNSQQIKA